MLLPDIHYEYQELFEDFFCKMLDLRDQARDNMYKPVKHYEDFLQYGNFDLYGLTAACSDAEVYGWCLELWALDCHHPVPVELNEGFSTDCPVCRQPLTII